MLTLDLFQTAAARSYDAAQAWIDLLQQIPENAYQGLFEQLPSDEITTLARQFAIHLLILNKQRLIRTLTP